MFRFRDDLPRISKADNDTAMGVAASQPVAEATTPIVQTPSSGGGSNPSPVTLPSLDDGDDPLLAFALQKQSENNEVDAEEFSPRLPAWATTPVVPRGHSVIAEEYNDDDDYDQPPAWATTPVLPRAPPARSHFLPFTGRSPLRQLVRER